MNAKLAKEDAGYRALLISAVLFLAVGLTSWGAKPTLAAAAALLLIPVAAGLSVWAKRGVFDA